MFAVTIRCIDGSFSIVVWWGVERRWKYCKPSGRPMHAVNEQVFRLLCQQCVKGRSAHASTDGTWILNRAQWVHVQSHSGQGFDAHPRTTPWKFMTQTDIFYYFYCLPDVYNFEDFRTYCFISNTSSFDGGKGPVDASNCGSKHLLKYHTTLFPWKNHRIWLQARFDSVAFWWLGRAHWWCTDVIWLTCWCSTLDSIRFAH